MANTVAADEPAFFRGVRNAQPLPLTSQPQASETVTWEATQPTEQSGPFKWRVVRTVNMATDEQTTHEVRQASASEAWRSRHAPLPPRIINASQVEPREENPFDDPFGDRENEAVPPSALDLPGLEAPTPAEPNAATDDAIEPEFQPAPPLNPLPLDSEPAAPADSDAPPAPPLQPGPANLFPGTQGKPCNQIYNERDCCMVGDRCNEVRQIVHNMTIDKISLDITPVYKPDAHDIRSHNTLSKLSAVPSRTWRNRQGEVLATGKLTNIVNQRVLVKTSGGEIVKLSFMDLSDDDHCFVAGWWGLPPECTLAYREHEGRHWTAATMTWKASALCHKPLYFEETQLERYGHTTGRFSQPFVSGAHFFGNIAVLPYKMGIHPIHECQYSLGYYRPGSCAPWLVPPVPVSLRGALLQTGAVLGGIYALP